jgi:hypothetical protein
MDVVGPLCQDNLVEAILAGAAATALSEGVKFLYAQAGEFLRAWRERRREPNASAPVALASPPGVTVGDPHPVADAPSGEAIEMLQELKDLVEPIKDGAVPVDSPEARRTIAALRNFLESLLGAPITLEGEQPRTLEVSGVDVAVQRVAGNVAGVRAGMAKLRGQTEIRDVTVKAGDVEPGGGVTGVDLT